MDIKVLVAAHKDYRMPEDPMYLPVQVGTSCQNRVLPGFRQDNTGEHISEKNPRYCELTALYWGWKNLSCDYLGLVHYRRHFVSGTRGDIWDHILSSSEAQKLFQEGNQAILPRKRRYVIETLYSHYEHSHHAEDLIVTADVIHNFYPEYADTFVQIMKRRSAHMFNMCIMEKPLLDAYCEWLFSVLALVEERLDISSYSDFDKRVFGRISELLLDVWIEQHHIKYTEVAVRNTEGEHMAQKIVTVMKRKLTGNRSGK